MHIPSGYVFDIQRFSLHDGPGIRTTVFLKGCPLSCIWCHNPESLLLKPQLSYSQEKCINCGKCVKACEYGVHSIKSNQHYINFSACRSKGACADICEFDALSVAGKILSADEVMDEVIKDKLYYAESGGGVTFSGGEPLLQPEFLLAMLKLAKREKIHTCVETSGYAKENVINDLLPLVDTWLFDIKSVDSKNHKELTGAFNELIFNNLKIVHKSGTPVILRFPLISGVNDSETHLNGLCELLRVYKNITKAEIMPYHNIGAVKYKRLGMEYKLTDLPGTPEETLTSWKDFFRQKGFQVIQNCIIKTD